MNDGLVTHGVVQPVTEVEPPEFDHVVSINHNFLLSGDLAYKTAGGSPIAGAQVRVYQKSVYDTGNLGSPIGVTTTNANGEWTQPVLVPPGFEYVVRFEKPNEYGPDVVVITVV